MSKLCGAAKLVHDTRDQTYTYKGETTVLPQVTGDFCLACDESILDAAESRRTMHLMLAFNKQVMAASERPRQFANQRAITPPFQNRRTPCGPVLPTVFIRCRASSWRNSNTAFP